MNNNNSGDLYKKFSENIPAVLAYSHSAGDENLRAKIVSQYGWNNFRVSKEHLLICNGIAEAFLLAIFTCLDRKEELLALTAVPEMYSELAAMSGITLSRPAIADHSMAGSYKAMIESAVSGKTKAMLISQPLSNSWQVELIKELVMEKQLFLVEDFSALHPGTLQGGSFLQDPGLDEYVIGIGHPVNKAVHPQQYLGLMVTRNQEVLQAANKWAQARVCPSVPDQVLCGIYLDD